VHVATELSAKQADEGFLSLKAKAPDKNAARSVTRREGQKILDGTSPVPYEAGSLKERFYPVVFIGSKDVRGEPVSMAVGITVGGEKQVLGLWQGHTTDISVSRRLVDELWERGLSADRGMLAVCYGSFALEKAIGRRWGRKVLIAHCQYHVCREVTAHLPAEKRAGIRSQLKHMWQMDPEPAKTALLEMVERLRSSYPGAAARLQRSIEPTLTVARLGIPEPLRGHLQSAGVLRIIFQNTVRMSDAGKAGIEAVISGLNSLRSRRIVGRDKLPVLVDALEQYVEQVA